MKSSEHIRHYWCGPFNDFVIDCPENKKQYDVHILKINVRPGMKKW